MKKYTVETLKKENYHFDYEHGITESDVMKVNKIIDAIENSRSTERIQVGDVVQYTNEYGEYFPHAMITNIYDNTEICENGNMYTNIHEGEFCHSTSGGSFSHHEMKGFTYIGKTTRTFWTFGHNGACANGGVYFTATVNLWECNDNKEMFSTKTHDKYYLSYRKSDSDYQYFASKSGGMSDNAWRTAKEMQAWLRTKRAIVTGENTWGGAIIWTYKEVKHHCSNTEYDALNVTEDIFLMNGSKRRCKRVYDDENCIIHTYFVWYWEDDSQEFYARMSAQNKIIDSYKVDYSTNKVNKIALEELRSGKVKPLQIDFER
uniref:DUF4121 family protein n=1 Tax=Siphoviridae sp. ctqPo10 TaxID=2827948 RepID=A0A8S5SUW5_9CAUD|nr:MAG TPA: protein of unknown function (DUF4121) [Siphoviridae sp. ctqPo10]DAS43595.1 MAG TPA: protein of unknown function (DUF4121) [Caudoviricetes sp.]